MARTFDILDLGVEADIDLVEGDGFADNASALVGLTFGSAVAPLYDQVRQFSPGSSGCAGGTYSAYSDRTGGGPDRFVIDGGAAQTFDAVALHDATIIYFDGTGATITAVTLRDTAGNTCLAPEATGKTDQAALEAKPTESLTLASLAGGMAADRDVAGFLTGVPADGTAANGSWGAGYADAEDNPTDGADGDDDRLYGEGGADTIDAGTGRDTAGTAATNGSGRHLRMEVRHGH